MRGMELLVVVVIKGRDVIVVAPRAGGWDLISLVGSKIGGR